jgi:hypothetical protein
MVDATDAALDQRPEPLNALRVNVAIDVDAGRLIDPLMGVAALATPIFPRAARSVTAVQPTQRARTRSRV